MNYIIAMGNFGYQFSLKILWYSGFQLALQSMLHLIACQGCATEISRSNPYNTEEQVQDSSRSVCVAQKPSVVKVLSHSRMS